MMWALHLWAGIGTGALGAGLLGWRTVGYVEESSEFVERLCQRVRDGVLDDAPVFHGTVDEFVGEGFADRYRAVAGGLVLCAFGWTGKNTVERSGAFEGAVRAIRPRCVFVGGRTGEDGSAEEWIGVVLGRLAACGYDAEWEGIPAAACGAPHTGDVCWVVAESRGDGAGRGKVSGKGVGDREHPPCPLERGNEEGGAA